MKNVMGLDIDEICESTINISRKNYADLIINEISPIMKLNLRGKKKEFLPCFISLRQFQNGPNDPDIFSGTRSRAKSIFPGPMGPNSFLDPRPPNFLNYVKLLNSC